MTWNRSRVARRALSIIAVAAIATGTLTSAATMGAAQGDGTRSEHTTRGSLAPDRSSSLRPARILSKAERRSMEQRYLAKQESVSLRSAPIPGEQPAADVAGPASPETRIVDRPAQTEFHGNPATFVIGRNNKITPANGAGGSTLAEPSAVNEGIHVLAAGNLSHAEYSTNGGVAWTSIALPAGPADAPLIWGDTDMVYDRARGVAFYSQLYLNAAQTNGVVRIFVRTTIPTLTCTYTIDPGGTADNVLPDYPHLGLTNDFLYLATNNVTGSTWVGSQMRRFNLDQMVDCLGASFNTYTYTGVVGQRIFTPAQSGATETEYWASLESATQLRIFSWPETTTTVTSTLRTISATSFGDPDCRGGTGNRDYTGSTFASPAGFRLRTAVGGGRVDVYWQSVANASIPQAHVRGAIFRELGLALLAQPAIWNSTNCIGFPAIATNDRGDLGFSMTYGGKAGGLGTAAQGVVGMDDDFTAGLGLPASLFIVASGTDNRTDSRHGDYFTVRPQTPCGLFFSATNYALSGGTALANLNSRYLEFGRNRDNECYTGWRNFRRI